jgi:hypothetical protein
MESIRPSSPDAKPKLLDLPVELRLAIYEHIFVHEDEPLGADIKSIAKDINKPPKGPAICRVNRAIRRESLDFWYNVARFPVQFHAIQPQWGLMSTSGTSNYQLVTKLEPEVYSRIQKFVLCFSESYGLSSTYYRYNVDLDSRRNSYTITHAPLTSEWWVGYRPWNIDAHKKAERRVIRLRERFDMAVAEMIARSGGVKNLTLNSYHHLAPQACWKFGEDIPDF